MKINSRPLKSALLILMPLLCTTLLNGQGVTGVERYKPVAITFQQALDMTLSDNPQVLASKFAMQATEQERKAAFGLRLPKIGVIGSYVRMGSDIHISLNDIRDGSSQLFTGLAGTLQAQGIVIPPELTQGASQFFGSDWTTQVMARDFGFVAGQITLPVYAGGKINAANRAARIRENTAGAKDEQTRAALVSELVERYYGLKLANSVVEVRRLVVDAVQRHLRDAVALENNGVIARSQRLYVEAKLSEAERDLIASRLQAATTANALANTINGQILVQPSSPMFVLNALPPIEEFVGHGLTHSPVLRQVELTRDLAQEGVKLQRAEFLPQVALMGGANVYNYHRSRHLPRWIAGAGVTLNLFDGLNREHKYKAAKYTARQAETMLGKVSDDIEVGIIQLYNELQNYSERMPSIDKSIEFHRELVRVAEAGFREGVTSASEVIDADLDLASALIEKLQTAYKYDLVLARLMEMSGAGERFADFVDSSSSQAVVVVLK